MRDLVKILILFEVLLNFELTLQDHPYGKSVNILKITDEDGSKQFSVENDVINVTFLHPEVKDRKIVVLSIIGAYRKGKSFFLDYCLRFLYANYRSINNFNESKPIAGDWIGDGTEPLQGFSWRHGSTADTKGIILWSDVFLHDTPTEKIAIVVMDTQGLFEPGSTHEENGRIFGLSTLLSSIQILNIKNELQEDHLEYLETATSLTNFIVKRQKASQWKPFQRLLFLFRDWTDDEIGYGYEGGKNYLDKIILKVTGNETAKANVIRKNIRASFDEILCFLLDFPGSKITKGHGEWSSLKQDFVINLKILIESLMLPENLIKKSTLGTDLTAEEFQALIKIYFEAFANAKLPNTENILQIAIDNQMQTIVNAQLKVFNQLQVNINVDYDREDFVNWVDEVHENNTKTAVDGFLNAEKLDDDESSKKFEKILKEEIENIFKIWNQTTIKSYILNLQLKNYRKVMSTNLDFNQEDFEKYYENLHKTSVANAIQGLDKLTFKDEASKANSIKSLELELKENYAILNSSSVVEFNQHLNAVSMLADMQFEAYKRNLNLYLDYEQNIFESYIDEKHLTAKNTAINGFENSLQQLTFTPRKTQFKEKLITKIDSEYLTWKEAKLIAYDDNLMAVSAFPAKHLKDYKINLNRSINYENYENFENYITEEQITTKNLALSNFDNSIAQLSFAPKMSQFKENLISNIDSGFNAWKAETISTYNSKVNEKFQQLEDTKLSKYRGIANIYIDVSKDNWLDVTSQLSSNATDLILPEFVSETNFLNNAATQLTYKSQLSLNIDGDYIIWKANKTAERDQFVINRKSKDDKTLSSIHSSKLQSYKNTIESLDDDFTNQNYENDKRNKITSVKSTIISEFNTETSNIHDRSSATSKSNSLANTIDSFTSDFMSRKIATFKIEHQKFVEDRKEKDDKIIFSSYKNVFHDYKEVIEATSDFYDSSYESLITTKHESEKTNSISELRSQTNNVQDNTSVEHKITLLTNEMESFKDQKITKWRQLRNDGIWVPWNSSKSGVPQYAVIGGNDGNTLYVVRDKFSGRELIGKYNSRSSFAYFADYIESEERSSSSFEIFTHTHYSFLWRPNRYKNFIGDICRSSSGSGYGKNNIYIPGTFYKGNCYISHEGKVDKLTYNYENLIIS